MNSCSYYWSNSNSINVEKSLIQEGVFGSSAHQVNVIDHPYLPYFIHIFQYIV